LVLVELFSGGNEMRQRLFGASGGGLGMGDLALGN